MKDDSRYTWGISLLVFGLLFLLRKVGVFPQQVEDFIFNVRNIPFTLGVIFLFSHKNKSIGIVLISTGILFYINNIIVLIQKLSDLIWPLLLIGAGAILIFSNKSNQKKIKSKKTSEEKATFVEVDEEKF